MQYRVTPEVFLSRIDVGGPDDCWDYRGAGVLIASGHKRIAFMGGKTYAHRAAYLIEHGVWPLWCLHHCDRPICVNPAHLYSGTPQQNVADRDRRGRRASPPLRPLNWSCKLSQLDLDELHEAQLVGVRASVCATEYGVSVTTVRSVWRRANEERAA